MPKAKLDPDQLREFRDQTLFRLVMRLRRVQNTEVVERLHERGHRELLASYPLFMANVDTEGTTITALAAKAGVTRQAASQQIQEIEARGFVERHPDPRDGRAVIVRFSPRGRRVLDDAIAIVTELEADYAAAVGKKRFEALRKTLSELVEYIDPVGRLEPPG